MGTIDLRAATPADSAFCYELHRAAMGRYVEAIWGWDEDDQRSYHERGFDPARTRIITVDGEDAGMLVVEYRPDEVYLARIEIHPDYQGHGIGSRLIRQVVSEAAGRGQPVVLDVLAVNHRAYALYERLGFGAVGRHGPDKVKIRMRWPPPVGPPPQEGHRD